MTRTLHAARAAALLAALVTVGTAPAPHAPPLAPGAPASPAPAQETTSPSEARVAIEDTVDAVSTLLNEEDKSQREKKQRFHEIVEARLDIDEISRRVLRNSWDDWRLSQRNEFKALFVKHLVGIYWKKVDSDFEGIEILEDSSEASVYWRVKTRVDVENAPSVEIEFILQKRRNATDWKIIDLLIDRVSQVSLFRDDYTPIVRGGGPEALLAALEKKVAAEDADTDG